MCFLGIAGVLPVLFCDFDFTVGLCDVHVSTQRGIHFAVNKN
jgi:hypothetical protein